MRNFLSVLVLICAMAVSAGAKNCAACAAEGAAGAEKCACACCADGCKCAEACKCEACCACCGAAGCQTFAFADFNGGKVYIMEAGELVWEYPARSCNDLWVLPNGNLLFTNGNGVLEVTRDKEVVFSFKTNSSVYACQRLPNGNTFVGECEGARFLEVSPEGEIVKEVSIMPEGMDKAPSSFMRNARRLDNGNFLAAHYGGQKATEYNDRGEVVWNVEVPGGPHSLIRLPDGNTIVAVADMNKNARLVEFDPKGNIVWEISNEDVEGDPFKFLGGLHYVDGTIMVSNWLGHGQEGKAPNAFLIDKNAKKIICTFDQREGIRAVGSIYRHEVPLSRKSVSVH